MKQLKTVCFLKEFGAVLQIGGDVCACERQLAHFALVAVLQAPQLEQTVQPYRNSGYLYRPERFPWKRLAQPKRSPSWLRQQTELAQKPKITAICVQVQTRCWFWKARSHCSLSWRWYVVCSFSDSYIHTVLKIASWIELLIFFFF